MAVTSATQGYAFASSNMTAPTPTGSGGALVVGWVYRDNTPTPNTGADWQQVGARTTWSEAAVVVYISRSASPDMVFTRAGSNESRAMVWRIDNASATAAAYATSNTDESFAGTTRALGTDVSTAPNGCFISVVGTQDGAGGTTVTSTTLGLTEAYDGIVVSGGFWAKAAWGGHLDGVTPGGGTFSVGSITMSSDQLTNHVNVVVETGGGGDPAGSFAFGNSGRRGI